MSLAAYNTLQHEIRRHVTGGPKFQAYAPEGSAPDQLAFKLYFYHDARTFIYQRGSISTSSRKIRLDTLYHDN